VSAPADVRTIREIPLDAIEASAIDVRSTPKAIDELADSIREHGVLQPLLLHAADPAGAGPFEIIAGRRRLAAARVAGLATVPAIVEDRPPHERLELQLIENIQREDLDPIEQARGIAELQRLGETIETIAKRLGWGVRKTYATRQLLDLDEVVQEGVREGDLTPSVALLVARIPKKLQREAAVQVTGMPFREAKVELGGFSRPLFEAPWDQDDAELVPKAGACTACPHRFDDDGEAALCLNEDCFDAKRKAFGARRIQEAAAAGATVLKPKAAKGVFERRYDHRRGGEVWRPTKASGYVGLDERCDADPKGRTYRKLLAKAAPPVVLAPSPAGDVVELVAAPDAKAALKKAGVELQKPSRSTSPDLAYRRQQAEWRKKAELENVAKAAVRGELVAAIEQTSTLESGEFWRLLAAAAVAEVWYDHLKQTARRRGLEVKGDVHGAIGAAIANASAAEAKAWTVELLCHRGDYRSRREFLHEACGLYSIDHAAIEKRVRAAAAAAAKPKKKPAAKKKPAKKKAPRKARAKGGTP